MRKTLSEWIEWADNKPTTSTDILVKKVCVWKTHEHEQLHALRTGLPVNYDQKITIGGKPRKTGSNK